MSRRTRKHVVVVVGASLGALVAPVALLGLSSPAAGTAASHRSVPAALAVASRVAPVELTAVGVRPVVARPPSKHLVASAVSPVATPSVPVSAPAPPPTSVPAFLPVLSTVAAVASTAAPPPTTAAPVVVTVPPTTTTVPPVTEVLPTSTTVPAPTTTVVASTLVADGFMGCPTTQGWGDLVACLPWPTATIDRVISCESGGNPSAYNPSGATGLFQILEGPTDPIANVELAFQMWSSRGLEPWDASAGCWG